MQTLAQSNETCSLNTSPWYVVHAKPRAEARALENLERQGFEVFLPMITLQKVRRARVANITEPMFSRYLFLRATPGMQDLSVVRSTMGVSQLVRFGQVAAKVPHTWVEALRAQPLARLSRDGERRVALVRDGEHEPINTSRSRARRAGKTLTTKNVQAVPTTTGITANGTTVSAAVT